MRIAELALQRRLITEEQFHQALRDPEALRSMIPADEYTTLVDELKTAATIKLAPPVEKTFGKYVLVKQVGQGGFGAVYRAREPQLGRTVALKFLHSEDLEDVARFMREAQMAAKLAHPNIVPLHEVGEFEGRHYLAMEFIEGVTLSKLRVEPRRALEILRDVAGAVQYAHERGIIHRDLKPQNVMVSDAGHVWVMDFGLARQLRGGTTLTVTGAIVGTPAYMPPEQARGDRCDVRSDVYSLGATLYELVTGHTPFEGGDAIAILDKVRSEEPVSPRRFQPRLDPEIETIVAKAMDKSPDRRYATAKEFAKDIERHLHGEPIVARPASLATKARKWAKRHVAISAVGAVMLLVLASLGAVLIANALRFRRTIRDLEARAQAAETAERFEEAAGLWREIRTLMPAHPTAELRETAARGSERRAAADRWLAIGRKAEEEHSDARRQAGEKRREERALGDSIPLFDGEAKKAPLWSAQREAERLEKLAEDRRADALRAFAQAAGIDPGHPGARSALASMYFAGFEEAERRNDIAQMRLLESLTLLFDDGTFAPKLARTGLVELDTDPPGAEVELWRYEEAPDRRLLPRREGDLGRCPVSRAVPGGSWLLILRKEGYRDVRFPVRIDRGTGVRATIRLYTEDQIGAGFLYVPKGPFVQGRDRQAYQTFDPERETASEPGDFFIGRCEVKAREYVEFLGDRSFHDVEAAWARTPRETRQGTWLWWRKGDVISLPPKWDPEWPVFGISWSDAKAYADWLSSRARQDGESVLYRLPTSAEWEKSARGADGRGYPWGDRFDFTFTKGARSREGDAVPERVAVYERDESPYGVRDLAGSLKEWCEDGPEKSALKFQRGGCWRDTDPNLFRGATRTMFGPTWVSECVGFRLVRVLR